MLDAVDYAMEKWYLNVNLFLGWSYVRCCGLCHGEMEWKFHHS